MLKYQRWPDTRIRQIVAVGNLSDMAKHQLLPSVAVEGVVAVVAEDKDAAGGNFNGAKVVKRLWKKRETTLKRKKHVQRNCEISKGGET